MLKVAVVILTIGCVFAGIYSLMTFIAPKAMLKSTFKTMTGKELDSIQDRGYLDILTNRHKRAGFYAAISVIFSFFVLFAGFRKAQKWAWWCFLAGGGIAWIWGLADYIALGSKMHIVLQSIGTVIFLVGVLLPVKAFFGKEIKEEAQEA